MLGMSVMIAAQLGYYGHKKSGMTPSYSTTVLPGTQIRLIPPGKKVKEMAIVKSITHEFVVVEYEDKRLGTQEISRLYFDTRSEAERQKGQDWYEVKKAAVCGKCVRHEAECCVLGCLVGETVALCDEALMNGQVHPCAVTPDAAMAGCILACACQSGRICWKARKSAAAKEKRKQRAEEQARQRDQETQRQPPVQGIPLQGRSAEPYQPEYESAPPTAYENPYPEMAYGNMYGQIPTYNPDDVYEKQVVYPDDAPQYPTRGSRGVGSNVSGGSRSRPYAGSPGATPSRVARGVAAADHSLAGDAEMSSYWEEKQRRQRIQRLLDQGGDPTAEEHRSLFDRPSAHDTATDVSYVSNRQPRRKTRSAVSSETADLVSLRDSQVGGSQVGGSSVAYNSQDEYATRSPGSRVRAPGPNTRLGVRSSAGW